MRTRKPQPRADARRRAILDAALALYAEGGEDAVQIKAIGAQAEASVGSIYHHFGSREGVFAALYDDLLGRYREQTRAAIARRRSTRGVIATLIESLLRFVDEEPAGARLLYRMREHALLAGHDETLRRSTGAFMHDMKRHLVEAVARGEVRDLPYPVVVPLVMGPAHELCRQHLMDAEPRRTLVDLAPVLADAAWRSIAVKPC